MDAGHSVRTIGDLPVTDIAVDDVRRVLDPIWREKPETARATIGETPAAWRNNLQAILPSPRTIVGKEPENHPALHWKRVGTFTGALQSRKMMSAAALASLACD